MIPDLTSVCFGWSSLGYDSSEGNIVLNMSRTALGLNDLSPCRLQQQAEATENAGVPALLMVLRISPSK